MAIVAGLRTGGEAFTGSANLDATQALELAQRFNLAARVASRTPSEILVAEVGYETGRLIQNHHASAAARFLIAESVCRELAELGQSLRIQLIFLKGAALQIDQKVIPGSRDMGDIDVLVPASGARSLQEALIEGGCEVFETRESEHQMQCLTHRLGLAIEVHKIVPGVRVDGASSATADQLIDQGLVHAAQRMSGDCFVPADPVMLAHILVHGIAQHGMAPSAYPMSRMLADLQDLAAPRDAWQAARDWIEHDVSREETDAAASLVNLLGTATDLEDLPASAEGAGVLLRHLVAGVLIDSYEESMKFRSLTAKPTDVGAVERFATMLRGAVLLTDVQIDMLYGPPATKLGYWGWRLWRPFDLVVRSIRYGAAWVRNRFRR
jgi:hypothetical protein